MNLKKEEFNKLILIENKLSKNKKYYNEFCELCTIIERLTEEKIKTNKKNYERIKTKRATNKNYARGRKKWSI